MDRLFRILQETRQTVATAESCTGGLLATFFTDLPGSSRIYMGGIACYSNWAKEHLLGVPSAMIEANGAVSDCVARVLADQARIRLHADFGLSLTGVAGPEGGSVAKPVGTVWCGMASKRGSKVRLFQLTGTRAEIRHEAAKLALDFLIGELFSL